MASVAKWLRQWFVVPPCVGSIPIIRPQIKNHKKKRSLCDLFFFGVHILDTPCKEFGASSMLVPLFLGILTVAQSNKIARQFNLRLSNFQIGRL